MQLMLRLIHWPRVPPLSSFGVSARRHCRFRLLGPLTEICLDSSGLDARPNRRAQSLQTLGGAVGSALLRYWPQPRPLP